MQIDKKVTIEKFKKHPSDTGSPEVQIALLTGRINHLAEHFKKAPKDFTTRVGFLKMIGRRRTLLDYLKKVDTGSYQEMLKTLELRK